MSLSIDRVHRRAAGFAARTLHPAQGHDAGKATSIRQDSKVAAG
jgi:hypothetical protein